MLLKLAAIGAIGYAGYRYFTREAHSNYAAYATGQASDESFPASDPPGNY